MSMINITNVVIDNPLCVFTQPIRISVTFESLGLLESPIQWRLIYIGSAKDQKLDQVLDQFEMEPLPLGVMQFQIEAPPPDSKRIPADELLKVTAMILSASYQRQEFFRVGYYVYNQYVQQQLSQELPSQPILSKIMRTILCDKPRITRSEICWQPVVHPLECDKSSRTTMEQSEQLSRAHL